MQRFLEELITGKKYRAYTDTQQNVMFPLEQFFPSEKIDGLSIDFVKGAGNAPIILRASTMEEKAHPRQRDDLDFDDKRCVYFKDSYLIGTEELARLKDLEEKSNQDPKVMRAVEKIYKDQIKLENGARATAEYMRAQLMCNGIIQINDNGIQKALDYKLKDEQKFTASVNWSDPAAKILDDIRENIKRAKKRGENPDVAMANSEALGNMMKNTQIIAQAKALAGVTGDTFMTEGLVQAVIKSNFNVSLLVNDENYRKADGALESFWEDTKFTLFSSSNLPGKTNFGTSANELMVGIEGKDVVSIDDDSYFLYIKWEDDPVSKKSIIDMNCVPSLEGGNSIQIMTIG